MDEFFQKLREIQKKERNLSGLAPVGENFYQNISKYFNILMRKIDDNPFSFESYLLRDAQRITAEICERREHKISNSAVMSVQRTFQLFNDSETDSLNLSPKIPRNSTPEEEKLFHALVDSLTSYREKMRGPLRYHASDSKDKVPDISEEKSPEIGSEEKSPEIGDEQSNQFEHNTNTSREIDNSGDKNTHEGFTPEEEAAIDDNIYKQFGNEPFPDSNLKIGDKPQSTSKKPYLGQSKEIDEKSNGNNQTDVILVLEELPSIMGIDKNVYGPLLPQDIVSVPEPTARILIKNQKGKSIQKYK